jgi:hypothetical protein
MSKRADAHDPSARFAATSPTALGRKDIRCGERHPYARIAVIPPSTTSVWPVM